MLPALTAAALLGLVGCSAAPRTVGPGEAAVSGATSVQVADLASALGYPGRSAKELVSALDSSDKARPLPFTASVKGTDLVVKVGGKESAIALPTDSRYVSVAPYRDKTHECFFHSLATCRGELAKQDVRVTITAQDGTVLIDKRTRTYANGFVGYWLPKDVSGTITIEHHGHRGSVPFSTTDGSPSCITSLKVA
jgi:hypothetical protein